MALENNLFLCEWDAISQADWQKKKKKNNSTQFSSMYSFNREYTSEYVIQKMKTKRKKNNKQTFSLYIILFSPYVHNFQTATRKKNPLHSESNNQNVIYTNDILLNQQSKWSIQHKKIKSLQPAINKIHCLLSKN